MMLNEEHKKAMCDMIYLIACCINNEKISSERVAKINFQVLYQISCFHNLAAITFMALEKFWENKIPQSAQLVEWQEVKNKAICKTVMMDIELKELFAFCEENNIWYMPLKGIIMKELYPRIGMRQMADNDILFDKTYQGKIYQWFIKRGYESKNYQVGNHDCYYKKPVFNFEMHTALFGETYNPICVEYYKNVKERLFLEKEKSFAYRFCDEDFYIYITNHAFKHYCVSGTGFRTLLDCYVFLCRKEEKMDWHYIETETDKLGITQFEQAIRTLSKKLYSDLGAYEGGRLVASEQALLEYMFMSGTYGIEEHRIRNALHELGMNKKNPSIAIKCKYIFQRAFPDKIFMSMWCKEYCPFFLNHQWLYTVARWWRILYRGSGKLKKILNEIETVFKV